MKNTRTKTIGVSFPFDVISEIEKTAPKIGAKTISDACRKMILAYLKFSGANIPDERFARLKREPLPEKTKKKLRQNLKRANAVRIARAEKLKQLAEERDRKPEIRRSKNPPKRARSAA